MIVFHETFLDYYDDVFSLLFYFAVSDCCCLFAPPFFSRSSAPNSSLKTCSSRILWWRPALAPTAKLTTWCSSGTCWAWKGSAIRRRSSAATARPSSTSRAATCACRANRNQTLPRLPPRRLLLLPKRKPFSFFELRRRPSCDHVHALEGLRETK